MAENKEVKEMEVVQDVQEQEAEAPKPNALLITVELAEALVGYLREQKMADVESLVAGIRGSRAVTVTDETQADKE
tara:strand:+ start:625 stop:852 length:228 start_codon:yes stop_codon:yes gene_type:complete